MWLGVGLGLGLGLEAISSYLVKEKGWARVGVVQGRAYSGEVRGWLPFRISPGRREEEEDVEEEEEMVMIMMMMKDIFDKAS